MLQEIIQKNPEESLEYVLTGESGPDHDKHFTVEVHLNSNVIGKGGGRSKKGSGAAGRPRGSRADGLLMRHANAAVFVPHIGCPSPVQLLQSKYHYRLAALPGPAEVRAAAQRAAETLPPGVPAEFAFFGGSFTAIGRDLMVPLLEAVQPFCAKAFFQGFAAPHGLTVIDAEILSLLKDYGVKAVELGAQSMDDAVLLKNGRGHTAADVERASRLIQEAGLSLGPQMMTGLPGDSPEGARETARRLAALRPETMRIYPAIVLPGTAMARWYEEGTYRPMELGEAIELCADLLNFFESQGIRVIRLGLHSSPELEHDRLAGPYHPAFRELCQSRRFLRGIERALGGRTEACRLSVSPRDLSAVLGQKRANVSELWGKGILSPLSHGRKFRGAGFPSLFPERRNGFSPSRIVRCNEKAVRFEEFSLHNPAENAPFLWEGASSRRAAFHFPGCSNKGHTNKEGMALCV